MRCLLLITSLFVCSATFCPAEPWLKDISEISELTASEGQPDSISIWLPSGERTTVGVYDAETIRVEPHSSVSARVFVQYIWERAVYQIADNAHVARIPYWLPPRWWRPPGQETGGPYAVQLHATEPGDHTVSIRCRSGKVLTVKLHVVEPIPKPDMGFGFYTVPPFWQYLDRSHWTQYFEHMAELKCSTFTLYASHPFKITEDMAGDKDAQDRNRAKNIAWQLDLALETGLIDGSVPVFIFGNSPRDHDLAPEYGKYVDSWPEMLGYGRDEPPISEYGEWEARGMVTMYNNNGEKPYRCGNSICDVGIFRFGDGIDVWICHMDYMSDLIKREALRQGKELWAYSARMRGTNAPLNRYFSGWWCFQNRPGALLRWCYMDHMLAYGLKEPSSVQPDGTWTPCGYFEFNLGAPDGPISSVGSEGHRDGVIDYMVLRDLERALLAARVNEEDDKAYYFLIREAAQWLQNNVDRVDVNYWPNDDWPTGNCEAANPCHWDTIDLAVPPIQNFNELRRQALEYTHALRAGPTLAEVE